MRGSTMQATFTCAFDNVMARVVRKWRGKTFVMTVPWWDAAFVK